MAEKKDLVRRAQEEAEKAKEFARKGHSPAVLSSLPDKEVRGFFRQAVSGYKTAAKLYERAGDSTMANKMEEYADAEGQYTHKHSGRGFAPGFAAAWRRLGRTTATASIIFLLGGLFFLSPSITGNVIGNMTQTTTNSTGIILIVLGLIGTFIYLKAKK